MVILLQVIVISNELLSIISCAKIIWFCILAIILAHL